MLAAWRDHLAAKHAAAGALGGFPGGVVANAPLTSTYFNMRKTTIYGGSNEIQKNIIAKMVLGL